MQAGGFDVVIGNPPYLRVQGLRENFEEESKFYETVYLSATGRFDIYVLFIEKAFNIMNERGLTCFILPHKFLNSDFGEGTREFLYKNKAISQILHFGSNMVFQDASTYTCILHYRITIKNLASNK
jgi:adenine-specific DNA-methyltransferase